MSAIQEAIRCTLPSCGCKCFTPGKNFLRTCDSCKHGWVAHALDKLGYRSMYQAGSQVEVVQPNIVFDIASLMLYGAHATPIRLKILLDRLFSVLQHDEVIQVLHGFGWTYEDYARGYILQVKKPDTNGHVFDKWTVATRDEEQVILQQFLRFGETKSIAQEIILADTRENRERNPKASSALSPPKSESDIKKFIERSNIAVQSYFRNFNAARPLLSAAMTYHHSPAAVAAAAAASRLAAPSVFVPNYSPGSSTGSTNEAAINMSMQASSPMTGSPLNRLQTMQPFDFRRDHLSPNPSPDVSEKSIPPSVGSKSPENLSISNTTTPPHSSSTPLIKTENPEDSRYIKAENEEMRYMLQAPSSDDDGVIDYSIKDNLNSSGESQENLNPEYDVKAKHLRKPSNPIKRNWQPSNTFGTTFISPSGKKRVLCTACNKSFCDKGALKIHYSAVHLKEMHKCTVEGCNMMFSSRRSRNRHSANPNPKLHMPNQKRKLPEGATVLDDKPPPNLPTTLASTSINNLPSSLSMQAAITAGIALPTMPSVDMKYASSKHDLPLGHPPPMLPHPGFYLDPSQLSAMMPTPPKMGKFDLDESSASVSNPAITAELNREAANEVVDREPASGSSRKRKSAAPIRCMAQNDEIYAMSDDENSDESAIVEPENLCLKSDAELDSDGLNDEEMKLEIEEKDEEPEVEASKEEEEDQDEEAAGQEEASKSCHEDDEQIDESKLTESEKSKLDDLDIPINADNPKSCTACGKTFENNFTVKLHYQNVHLKLMHTCNVDGCNAAFPSKRSRDRHSSNLNLHRKLLSTSSGDPESSGKVMSLRDEILPCIYDSKHFKGNSDVEEKDEASSKMKSLRDEILPCIYESKDVEQEEPDLSNNVSASSINNNLHNTLNSSKAAAPASPESNGNNNNNRSCSSPRLDLDEDADMETLKTDKEGNVSCHLCSKTFRDNLVLKEHFEKCHPKEMYHCTIEGCDKIFSTRKSCKRHSQNHNLHRHLNKTVSA